MRLAHPSYQPLQFLAQLMVSSAKKLFVSSTLSILVLFWTLPVAAQNFTNIRSTQTMTVRAITQSKNHTIWFASGKTLYSFDGTEITPISSPMLDEAGAIICLCEGSDDKMLVGCQRGLIEVNCQEYTCKKVDELAGQNITAILHDGKTEWIGTNTGLFRNRKLAAKLPDIVSLAMQENYVLISCMQGLKRYNASSSQLETLDTSVPSLVTCFANDANGHLLAGSVHKICTLSGQPFRAPFDSISLPIVKCMVTDRRGKLMVGCDGGLYEMDDELRHIEHDARNPRSFAGNTVWCMTTDHCGNLWIGSDNGLSVMTSSQSFCIYPLSSITHSGLGNQIYCLLKDIRQRIWLGGTNGIVCISNFGKSSQSYVWHQMNSPLHPLPHNRIRVFHEDPVWGIWAGTDGGLLHFDEQTGTWTRQVIDTDAHNWIYDVRREDDALIVTTYDDVYRIKPDSSAKHLDLIQKVDAKPVLDTRYASTHIGDALWDLTPNGLQICTPPLREESERSASLEGGQATQYDLPERFVSIYYESDENLIYLGGSDQFAIIHPEAFLRGQNDIWFTPEARFVDPSSQKGLSRGILIAMYCTLASLVIVLSLYFRQRRRIKAERIRRDAMLKSAYQKMHELRNDNNNLQQQLRLQQLASNPNTVSSEIINEEQQFLLQVNQIIQQNLDNPQLSVATLSQALGISSKQLYRKIKQCTDLTAVEYIRKLRLQHAASLLKNPSFTINEVMYMVGFNNPSYFSRTFAGQFGMSPTEYRNHSYT